MQSKIKGGVTLKQRPSSPIRKSIHNLSTKQVMHLGPPIVPVPLSFPGCKEDEEEHKACRERAL